jgi:hypothetical protein
MLVASPTARAPPIYEAVRKRTDTNFITADIALVSCLQDTNNLKT